MTRYLDEGDERILPDGGVLRVPKMMMDHRTIAIDYGFGGPNRPGHCSTVDHQAARDAAYDQMCRLMQDAWKSPERRQADTEIAAELGRDASLAMGDAQKIRDAAYARSVAALQWKSS